MRRLRLDFRCQTRTIFEFRHQEIARLLKLACCATLLTAFSTIQDIHRRTRQRRSPLNPRTFDQPVGGRDLHADGVVKETTVFATDICFRLDEHAPLPHGPEATSVVARHKHGNPHDRTQAHATDDSLERMLFLGRLDHVGQPHHSAVGTLGQTNQRQKALPHFVVIAWTARHQFGNRIDNHQGNVT
ncbi:hypothetical protein WK16_08805 [Burkholderia ubonensis]|nr:hypothetical protein WK16_08805 [Burkholderia ubonensis]